MMNIVILEYWESGTCLVRLAKVAPRGYPALAGLDNIDAKPVRKASDSLNQKTSVTDPR